MPGTTTPSTVTATTSILTTVFQVQHSGTTTVTNFNENSCRDSKLRSSKRVTLKTEDYWGVVFKRGVTYKYEAMELDGISAFPEFSGPYQIQNIVNGPAILEHSFIPRKPCVAKPMQSVTCKYIAYKAYIEVGFTIYWKNASPTRGIYKGQGWKFVMHETSNRL